MTSTTTGDILAQDHQCCNLEGRWVGGWGRGCQSEWGSGGRCGQEFIYLEAQLIRRNETLGDLDI